MFSLHGQSSGLEADGLNEIIQSVRDPLVESIELRETLILEFVVCRERPEQPGGEWGVDSFEQFQKNQADAVMLDRGRCVQDSVAMHWQQPCNRRCAVF
jgi:hypothetical protein